MNITEVSIKKPVFAWMIMLCVILFGLISVRRMGISQFPDVDFPNITVSVGWSGAAPEVIEHDVVEILEEALIQVEGVRSITSSSRQGSARITVELDISRDVDLALQDVQTKVSQAQRRLPYDLDPPVISKTNPEDQPIIWLGLSGPFSRQTLSDYIRYFIQEKLQTLPGVGEVIQGGYLERNVRIWIDADKLDEKNLTVMDVLRALSRQHIELPAGRLETKGRELNVRVMGEALQLDELKKLIIRMDSYAPVYLEDVALVEDGFEDVRRLSRVNGLPAQGLGVKKQRGANAVALARSVRNLIEEINKELPEGMVLDVNFDNTRFIEEAVNEIEFELILAVLLTAMVCWIFLGSISNTINVILAIPMSLMGTIAVMYFLGFTLNTFTLLGISLAVGIVVDDAIMIMENIFRHAESGKDRIRAAQEGTDEIKFAAMASTLALVAIFVPVVFMKGVIGKFFYQFGVALSCAVLFSYLEAITLAPSRLAQFLDVSRKTRGAIGRAVDEAFKNFSTLYARILKKFLSFPFTILIIAFLLFIGSIFLLARLPQEFVPSQDQSMIMIRLQTAVGADITETDRLFQQAEKFLETRPEVKRVFSVIGGFGGTSVNTGIMFITLVPPKSRALSQSAFSQIVRKELNSYPGLKAVIQDISQQGFTAQRGFPIEFSVRGPDWNKLVQLTDIIKEKLLQSGLVVDLDTDYQVGMPELRIVPDRKRAADLKISIEEIAQTINALVGGVKAGKFSTGGRRLDMVVRLMAGQRSRPEDLSKLRLKTPNGEKIPLSALVETYEVPALQAITRIDRERAITFFANPAVGHSQEEAIKFVQSLKSILPVGYKIVMGGASVAFQESKSSLIFALLMGIVVAYMILASQFNSFIHPFTIFSILPLSFIGATVALILAGKSLNIFSMIGFLLLMGIVKKNSIILVDYANRLREQGLNARQAMEIAGPVRLRPILMTSISTMMAVLPSSLALGPGSEIRQPMAIAVLGGLVVSTSLSLLVVPAFYLLVDRFISRFKKSAEKGRPVEPEGFFK